MCLQPPRALAESPKHSQMVIDTIQCYSSLLNPISAHQHQSSRLVDSQPRSGLSDSIQHNCRIADVLWRQMSQLSQSSRCQKTHPRMPKFTSPQKKETGG